MPDDPEELLTSREVAAIFRVAERTIRRWHSVGALDDCAFYTPGGKLRYRATAIRARITPPDSGPGLSPPPPPGTGPARPEGKT